MPEHAFVFCCFNDHWKITPAIFDVWMRLLHQVEGSVLWLLGNNAGDERNLRKEAQRRGIDPSRLVFAGRLPPAEISIVPLVIEFWGASIAPSGWA